LNVSKNGLVFDLLREDLPLLTKNPDAQCKEGEREDNEKTCLQFAMRFHDVLFSLPVVRAVSKIPYERCYLSMECMSRHSLRSIRPANCRE
jgi:hypothetical protein